VSAALLAYLLRVAGALVVLVGFLVAATRPTYDGAWLWGLLGIIAGAWLLWRSADRVSR